MPPSRPPHTVQIFGRDYTLAARGDAHPRLNAAASKLEQAMRTQKAQTPGASMEEITVLAALELIGAASSSSVNEREIGNALVALQRKIDRLEAALSVATAIPSEQSSNNLSIL